MPATPNTNKPAARRLTCRQCKTRFRTKSTKAIFCARTCKEAAAVIKRRIKYVERASDSVFMKQLAFEASRANTYEIFTGHTAESVAELYKLYAYKLKACQYGTTKDFELSHIAPSQGHDIVGLYHPLNLVVAPKVMNRAHGNQHIGHGLSIDRNKLQSRYLIEKGTPQAEIIKGIIQYIGPDIIAQATKIAGIKPHDRITTLTWLRDHLNPSVPEHRDWLESIDTMQTPALKALRAKLSGKEASTSTYTIKTRVFSRLEVLYQELTRHAQHRPDLAEVVEYIDIAVVGYVAIHFSNDWVGDRAPADLIQHVPTGLLMESELQALFSVLHGASVESIRPTLESLAERLPAYVPIRVGQRSMVRVLATLQSPVSFADELDALEGVYVQAIPPVLLGHTAKYEHDLLPWG